jgi:hypothetical protein
MASAQSSIIATDIEGTEATTSAATKPRSQFPNFRKAYDATPTRSWQVEVQAQLLQYAKMEGGWNSYDAPPITWDAGMFALNVLNDIMRPRTPIPQVVPSSVGGVQLEWHEKGIDLEIRVEGPYRCALWFDDHTRPDEDPLTADLTDDFSALLKPIELLTSR